ncbi:MAG: DEAD/DEAH box helicase family protein, partial [Planctomycetales bacterium]|nr:DEAD/DEAH box helicase family protein [Planctomycetales bacterium]
QLQAAIEYLPEFASVAPAKDEPVPARFTRPPPESHITEGSFFVSDDGTICQIVDGAAEPVSHGKTTLNSNEGVLGKRLAALLQLRDAARLVLQSQNEGWPESERHATRQSLNDVYDHFVKTYGPINKTTFGETAKGTVIRRMPNLVKFRDDPDAMLVMALEDYDEMTGTAQKTAIFGQDVVGNKPSVDAVHSAEEGLLVSLDRKGTIDLPFISTLYGKPEAEIIAELGDLIYRDPISQHWETADVYLSGNVRVKLKQAEQAGAEFARNVAALQEVQPPDVLPGDIDANLGAPWIPESDIQAFAAELFRVTPDSIRVAHLKSDAHWGVDVGYSAERSVAATSDFGTSRVNGTRLLELALNMKSPVVYDTISTPEGEERVLNQEATFAAREKQKQIKEKFKSWVFEDPERTERLVRLYNDTYNNIRLRSFDGSHLQFPGMNRTIELRPHQKDAIWRGMSSGNTLLAHTVGAGKTFTMAATGMKMRQAGLIHKPVYVVPNHMLEQFSREFMQLYPNAHLLVASKEDLSRDRRKRLTAKIASGDWDGIVVTHSSFERIGMSKDYQARFLREQIERYEQLLTDTAASRQHRSHRNLIKTIEKQKAFHAEKLKNLLAEEKKDDGLVFDELGVDHIFIDESHYFKNLETPTKMDRVAGVQTGGSQRAFDLYMKSRYLSDRNRGHGVTFATGTPISNTMVELFNLQRFLDPEGMQQRGIDHFDAWAATFGEVVEAMEISPDGASLRPRSRFARFNNLPELQQMFRFFADVQTAEMLDLPRPQLKTGKPITVSCPMSEEQKAIQQELVERYDRLRSSKVDPRVDNALAITTDGRKLALDARMLDAQAPENPHSKVNALVDQVERIWRDSTSFRGTQLVFCDLGIHPTAWGYSAYSEIIDKLVERGIPREQIAAMTDAESDAKKQALFEKVRNGSVRILLGSTQKMGTGTNVQKRLVALHHLDAPWKPAEVEQRDGRILRQGNSNKEVEIYRYVTEGSFDAYMWQALETKARFISQIMTGSTGIRRAEDIGGQELSYAEVKAIASGNPAVLTLAEADAEIQKLAILKKNHTDDQYLIRRKLKELPETIERLEKRVAGLTHDTATLSSTPQDDHQTESLGQKLDALPESVSRPRQIPLGSYRGLTFGLSLHPNTNPDVYLEGDFTRYSSLSRQRPGPRAVINALERLASTYQEQLTASTDDLALAKDQLQDYQARLGRPFEQEVLFKELTELRDRLNKGLSLEVGSDEIGNVGALAQQIASLLNSLKHVEQPSRPASKAVSASEEPIAASLKRRIESRQADESTSPVEVAASNRESIAPANDSACESLRTSSTVLPLSQNFRSRVVNQGPKQARQMSLF